MILGLDISTSITGVAVVSDGEILYYDSIDLRKHKDVFAKAIEMKEKIMDLFEMYQCDNESFIGDSKFPIEHIFIEQPFAFFNSGGSSAKTIFGLLTNDLKKAILCLSPPDISEGNLSFK